ncbi:MAG TPA: EAL domain-containing protein [Candidatus Accumulibacter phosphatis]|nr:EAL domain-containing protein [Candidatus Accumulibacter phosphatis]HRQ95590.1 EAL domain-containing protein [Candidatus Accumulibacter phosphatis]
MSTAWFLESVSADGSRITYNISQLPFRIGRDLDNDLVATVRDLSRHHAVLTEDLSGRLKLTDLDSTNGTSVNRQRLEGSCLLQENDILHFGGAEFRVGLRTVTLPSFDQSMTMLAPPGSMLSEHFFVHESEFHELLAGQGLSGAVQAIADAASGTVVAYEFLGRARHPQLPSAPMPLFRIARSLSQEAELSEAFRGFALAVLAPRLNGFTLFANVHPKETFDAAFLAALRQARQRLPGLDLVIEVHESAVTEVRQLVELAARLQDIGVRFAYDDFGAGQARLNELGEAPAHFVKFDIGLVRNIHLASERKRRVVADLVKLVLDLGSVPLAEGIECAEAAATCREMGFRLLQGFHVGRPIAADDLPSVSAPTV